MSEDRRTSEDWWHTEIIQMRPNEIRLRGYAIEDLIGRVSFPAMVWLMTRGDLPSGPQAELFGAALCAGVDHGPQAPSIAIARMASTCGVGINGAMASAANVLGDVHGGAGEEAAELYARIGGRIEAGEGLDAATEAELEPYLGVKGRYVPGFGHRFHDHDPRGPRLLELVDEAAGAGHVGGRFAAVARAVGDAIERRKGRRITMNVDGATAMVYCELGFPPALCRGLFVLSRSVGIMSHSWEQMCQGGRNKGPIPREYLWRYDGVDPRPLPKADGA